MKVFQSLQQTKILLTSALFFCCNATTAASLTQTAEMGVCEDVVTLERRCAMQASDCIPTHVDGEKNIHGEKYITVHQQRLQQNVLGCTCKNTPVHVCLIPKDDDPTQFEKTCVADSSLCSVENGSFFGASRGNDNADQHCTCSSHLNPRTNEVIASTVYGACFNNENSNDYFCSFRAQDCESPYVWIQPEDVEQVTGSRSPCTCDKVRLGACVSGFTGVLCAATEDECMGDSYFPPMSLEKQHGESCTLCEAAPSKEDNSYPIVPTNGSLDDETAEQEEKNNLGSIIVDASLFAGVLTFLLVVLCIFARRLNGRRANHDVVVKEQNVTDASTTNETTPPEFLDEDEGEDASNVRAQEVEGTLKTIV